MSVRSAVARFQVTSGSLETDFKKEDLLNSYLIGEEIGSGKFATVRKCKHRTSDVEYAAKVIRKRRAKSSRRGAAVEDIEREVTILREAQHSNIVKLFEVYETPQEVTLILELVSGGELFRYLAEREKVSEDEAINFQRQILEGIKFLHSLNIIHLDLKPENLVLDGNNNKSLKIIDFGLSRRLEANKECRDITGTPEFVAPEVINFDPLSTASDMWSIGVITYVMLSGLSPFLGDDKQETLSNVSSCKFDFDDESFDKTSDLAKDFIQKLLIWEPQKRASADACLHHPWIQPQNDQHALSRRISLINVVNLRSFIAKKRWKQSFHLVCLLNHLTRQINLKSNGSASKESDSPSSQENSQEAEQETSGSNLEGELLCDADKE